MPLASAVVLVIDRLSQGFFGAYGNTVIRTPEFDRLAAESLLLDGALIAAPRLDAAYDALWDLGGNSPGPGRSLLEELNQHGVRTALVTDEPAIAGHAGAADFAERELVEVDPPTAAAEDVADCAMARVLAAAADWIDSARSPFLLWIHARGLAGPWDAPYALRAEYADREDPAPPDFVVVPDRALPPDVDPDELLGVTQAYSGQVTALDACLEPIRAALAESPLAGSTLFCLLSSRGMPLGEHGQVGGDSAPLYGELISIPWMIRSPSGAGALERSWAIAQHQDLPATLRSWWDLPPAATQRGFDLLPLAREADVWPRQWAVIHGAGETAVRTPAWHLRISGDPSEPRFELFSKPSDRWEVNEVAARAPRICEKLAALVAAAPAPGPLDPELVEPVD